MTLFNLVIPSEAFVTFLCVAAAAVLIADALMAIDRHGPDLWSVGVFVLGILFAIGCYTGFPALADSVGVVTAMAMVGATYFVAAGAWIAFVFIMDAIHSAREERTSIEAPE